MVQLTTILVTASLTFCLGILSFVISQFIQRLYIEPAQEMRKTIGRIAHALLFHANAGPRRQLNEFVTGLDPEELSGVRRDLRSLASDLRAAYAALPR
jgi:hypothetical protein